MKVAGLNRKRHSLALLLTIFLERSGRAQGGVKGQVVGFSVGGPGLNVAAALAFCSSLGPASAVPAGNFIERVVDLTGRKRLPDFHPFTAIPPVGCSGLEYVLLSRLSGAVARFLGLDRLAHAFFFSLNCSRSSLGTGSGSALLSIEPWSCSIRS